MTASRTTRLDIGRSRGARTGARVVVPAAGFVVIVPSLAFVARVDDVGLELVVWGVALAAAAVGAGAIVGALWGPRQVRDPDAFRSGSVLAMSAGAVAIGSYLTVVWLGALLVPAGRGSLGEWLASILGLGTLGLVVFGLPALVVVVPHALVWRSRMRRWVDG